MKPLPHGGHTRMGMEGWLRGLCHSSSKALQNERHRCLSPRTRNAKNYQLWPNFLPFVRPALLTISQLESEALAKTGGKIDIYCFWVSQSDFYSHHSVCRPR